MVMRNVVEMVTRGVVEIWAVVRICAVVVIHAAVVGSWQVTDAAPSITC